MTSEDPREKSPLSGAISGAERADRILSLDLLRGLIMVLMAIDHASLFVAKTHSSEYWGTAIAQYDSGAWFSTRLVTHLCASGFFLLMGVSIVLFAASRQERGWSQGRVSTFFAKRGLMLIAIMFLLEFPAYVIIFLTANSEAVIVRGTTPGQGDNVFVMLGVLYGLGGSMLWWAFLRRLPMFAIAAIGVGGVLATQWFIPDAAHAEVAYAWWLRALLIPGKSDWITVLYPVLPWIAVTGLGVALGYCLQEDKERTYRLLLPTSVSLLLLFCAVRWAGGFGNFHAPGAGWIGFLNVTKYPPSLSFLLLTLGTNGILLYLFERAGAGGAFWRAPLLVFGRSALFFYILHLYVYALIGLAFRDGTTLPVMYGAWLFGLFILYFLCKRYAHFKGGKPIESVWRFF